MTWMNVLWLLVGLAIGVCIPRRQGAPESLPLAPTAPDPKTAAQLRQLQLAYQRATEMSQFKAGFLARISHELRSPLNGMIGMHQLILTGLCDNPEEEREFIEQAHDSAFKMIKVLDAILEVSKAETGTAELAIQPVQLLDLLQQVDTQTHLLAKNRNLHFQIEYPEPDLYVLADPHSLRQVLVSLITAAIAEGRDGAITLSIDPSLDTATQPERLHLWIDEPRPFSCWSEAIDLLQTPLPQDQAVPSPGLNLLANQTLLDLMQGRLEILALPEGSRIRCSIPVVIPDESEMGF
jgi:signal transduction histidine kinase